MSRFARLVAVGAILVALPAHAHDLGVSRSTLTEGQDGNVHGQFTFALREASAAFDGDGHVTIDVRTDGARCKPAAPTAQVESDALVVDEDFACTRALSSIDATVEFIGQMPGSHENIATLEGWGDSANIASELLSGNHRTIALELHRPRPKTPRGVFVAMAVLGALVLVVAIRSILRK